MDRAGKVLLAWLGGSALLLAGVESYTVTRGLPTISDRVRGTGRAAPIVVILTSIVVGYLLAHFWDGIVADGKEN